jgi:ABC-type glycerol-3-phosphate transport system substrate-binding protein
LQDSDTLRQAVNIFRQEYADIYVNLEIGMTDDNGVTLEDALKTLSTDILAGNGPDVLILDGMPVDSYVEKGILIDISDVVDEVKASDGLVDSIVKDSTNTAITNASITDAAAILSTESVWNQLLNTCCNR